MAAKGEEEKAGHTGAQQEQGRVSSVDAKGKKRAGRTGAERELREGLLGVRLAGAVTTSRQMIPQGHTQ